MISPSSEADLTWSSGNNVQTLVSVIITSFSLTQLPHLRNLIESYKNQKSEQTSELIFVLERDKLVFEQLVNILRQRSVSAKVFYFQKLCGMSDARNKGALLSAGDYIAFVDDDVTLGEEWLQSLIDTMENSAAIALTGPVRSYCDRIDSSWFPKELSWVIGSSDWLDCSEQKSIRNAWGCNFVTRRREFLEIGGFSTDFGLRNASRSKWADPPSEDVDLSIRLRRRYHRPILFAPRLQVGHYVSGRKMTWSFIAQRAYSVGHQRRAIASLYPSDAVDEPLSFEKSLIPKIMRLWPKSLYLFTKSPRKAMSTIAALFLVTLFSILGYFDRRFPSIRDE